MTLPTFVVIGAMKAGTVSLRHYLDEHPDVFLGRGGTLSEPNWPTGVALGIGGIAGGYLGARMQSGLPDTLIRRTVGILAIAIAAQFLRSGLS